MRLNNPFSTLATKSYRWLAAAREQRGNAAIEFAIVAPVLALLLVGTVQLGLAIMTWFTVQEGVLSGANYASHNGWNETAIKSAVTTSSTKLTTASVSVAPFCGCPVGSGITTVATCTTDVTVATNLVCPAACSTACADGITPRRYITLSASLARPNLMRDSFGLPTNITVTMKTKLP